MLEYHALGVTSDGRPDIRSIPVREHRIYYRIDDRALVIARVLHKAMDPVRRF